MHFILAGFLILALVMMPTTIFFVLYWVFFIIFMHLSIAHFFEFFEFSGCSMRMRDLFKFLLVIKLEVNFELWLWIATFHLS